MHFKSSLFSLLGVVLVGLAFAASSFAATPTNSVAPTISGYAHVGYTLTAVKGTWAGASTYTYKWQTSVNSGSTWTDITGATKSTYKPVDGDAANEVRVQVVATSSKKEASSAVSSAGVTVGNSAPTNVTAPVLTVAYAHVGYAIKASAGTWDAPSPSLKYQWQQCDSSGANCVDIAKATGSSYTPVVADDAKKLRVGVTPTNSLKQAATSPTYSAVTAAIGNAAPSNTVLPAIAGYLHNGYTVTANAGTWDAPKPAAKYQWQLCDGSGANCVDIAKATSASFAIPHGPDAGKTLAVTVTVTNAAKQTTSISSGASDVIGSAAPSSTAVPTLSGNAYVGQTLTAAVGTWDAPRPTIGYQWQLCTDNTDLTTCSDITGATKSTYKLLVAQAGKWLRVGEKATNVEKVVSSFSYSLVSGAVSSSQAKPTSAVPTIDDTTPNVGDVLTATHGSWGGSPAPTFTYQWFRCATTTPAGAGKTTGCTSIAKATAATYTTVSADLAKKIRVTVTGKNFVGSVASASDATAAVAGALAPSNSVLPSITGTAQDGQVLTAAHGTWDQSPTGYTYQWQTSANGTSGWSNLSGAASSTYAVQTTDVGNFLRVQANATNGAGSGTAVNSAATSAVISATPTKPVFVSGGGVSTNGNPVQPLVGDVVTCDHGTWSGGGTIDYLYTFITSGTLSAVSSTNQASNQYTIQTSDIGHGIGCIVNASNSAGSTTQPHVTSGTSPTIGPPVSTSAAHLNDATSQDITNVSVGDQLSVGNSGGWSGSAQIDFTYQWQYSTDGSTWNDIPGATSSDYTVGSYSGDYLQLVITATDAAGSTPHATQIANAVH